MKNKTGHILVVDDNRMNRIKISRSLQRLGHSITLAINGQKALEALQAESFDLILLDIFMPVMDGYQFLSKMKRDPTWQPIPVLVISAQEELDNVMKAVELGAEDYLPKRFDPRLLKARVNGCLEKKHLRDEHAKCLSLVADLTDAAAAIEAKTFSPNTLAEMAARTDEWGQLASILQKLAPQVYNRTLSPDINTRTSDDYEQMATRREMAVVANN